MLKMLIIPIIGVLLIGMTTAIGPNEKQKKFIDSLNKERWEYVVKNNISNMHELTWSEELHNAVQNLRYADNWADIARKTWRYTLVLNYVNGIEDLKQRMSHHIDNTDRENVEKIQGKSGYVPGMEHLLPLQKSVVCLSRKLVENYKVICFFGPEGNFFQKFEIGNPGSNCTDGFQNNNGLCSLISKKTLPTPSETSDVPNKVEITNSSAGIVAPPENPTVPPLQQSAETVVPANPTVLPQPDISPNDSSSVPPITTPAAPNPQVQMRTKNPQKSKTTTFYDKKLEEYDEKGGDVADEDDVDPTTLSSISSSIPIFIIFLFVLLHFNCISAINQ